MKQVFSIFVVVLFIFGGCRKAPPAGQAMSAPSPAKPVLQDMFPWKTYRILKGTHSSVGDTLIFFLRDTLSFRVSFDESARYKNANPGNQADWNKLMGFADCGGHHHQNSARLVWRYDTLQQAIEMGWYTYRNAVREFSVLDTVGVGDTVNTALFRTQEVYGFSVNETWFILDRPCTSKVFSYALFPYFGGDEVAPHDMHIHIQHLVPYNL